MANLALYRKYRSKDFDELVGQAHIATSLQNALKNGRISHAYLFTGPRGIGKTSTARILARRVNNLSVEQAASHLDIIEIDAASNRRIDEIRDLREKVHAAPTAGKYKVYIIDEVHMLTNEAFNALLKTLEEPPEHVIFILATTEPHKLPDTIISRTQRYSFRPVDVATLAAHLKHIAKAEKIKVDDAALELIAIAGDGSFRDSISLLDQLANIGGKHITVAAVSSMLGLADTKAIEALALAQAKGDAAGLLKTLDACSGQGMNASQLLLQLQRFWQHVLRAQLKIESPHTEAEEWLAKNIAGTQIAAINQTLAALPTAGNAGVALEAALLKLTITAGNVTASRPLQAQTKPRSSTPPIKDVAHKTVKETAVSEPETAAGPIKFTEDGWLKALTHLKTTNSSLYALLRSGEASYRDNTVVIKFRFQFHRRRLEELRNRRLVEEALSKVYGQNVTIKAIAEEGTVKPSHTEAVASQDGKEDKSALDEVLQILGGEVVQ